MLALCRGKIFVYLCFLTSLVQSGEFRDQFAHVPVHLGFLTATILRRPNVIRVYVLPRIPWATRIGALVVGEERLPMRSRNIDLSVTGSTPSNQTAVTAPVVGDARPQAFPTLAWHVEQFAGRQRA